MAGDWPRWRGPDDNGISTETGWVQNWPAEGPKQLWKASVGMGFSAMSVSQGHLYTMGHDGNKTESIYCLDAESGKTIWTKNYEAPLDAKYYEGGTSSTPTVDGDRVYTLSKRGELFCLDAAKGDVLWSKNVQKEFTAELPTWGFASSPVIEGNTILLNVGDAGLALKKSNGEVLWHSGKGASGYSTAVLTGKPESRTALFMASKEFIGLKVSDGSVLFRYPWKTSYDINAADPLLHDGRAFISSYSEGCALVDISGAEPKPIWQNKNLHAHFASSILWKGYIYGIDDVSQSRHELKCLSWVTGEVKWGEPSFGKGSLMLADGKIIGLSDHGELMLIEPSPEGFNTISRAQVLGGKCWTVPVLANGRIYCRNAKGDLVCLDVKAKL
jgi:outer membrane protein assembly factor BamB